jgi:carbonic anhydrase
MRDVAEEALQRLREGNRRFSNPYGEPSSSGDEGRRFTDLSAGQSPFAAVLACSDSRVPVETLFFQGAGDLFVIRVAGNVLGEPQLGSLEFAVEELGVPLILVLGHTGCGAVKAAMEAAGDDGSLDSGSENLSSIVRPILEVIEGARGTEGKSEQLSSSDVERWNVEAACAEMTRRSPPLAARVHADQLSIVGGIYHLETGTVEFHVPT